MSARTQRTKLVRLRARAPLSPGALALGPGAHFAKLSKKLGDGRYEAHLATGEAFIAGVSPDVDLELADRCMRDQASVLVGQLGAEIVVFGALQTRVEKDAEVVIAAPERLVLQAGKARIELTADGKMRLVGTDVTLDAPREIRLATAHVEIP
jgi:uncharacterized protein (DUF2345 family)